MLEEIQQFYDFIYKDLKEYISLNSKNKPYVLKKEPEDKLFPLVTVKENSRNCQYTTLKYTDYKYTFSLEINVYALNKGQIASNTICKEVSDVIERYFNEKYRMNVKVNPNAPNIDSSVSRALIYVDCTLDTKYRDKLIIYP